MSSIWTMGELLVEIMRPRADMPHDVPGEYLGPYPSGAPAIFIDTAARLGINAGIIGGVGNDGFGQNLLQRLEKDGVILSHVLQLDEGSTAVAFVMYRDDGSRQFIFHIKGTPATRAKMPSQPISDVGFFHVMGCSLTTDPGFCEEIIHTTHQMKENGAKISFDPNIRPELLQGDLKAIIQPVLENCSVLLPGVDELRTIAEADTIDASVEKLFKNPLLEVIVLKQGARGCDIITRENREHIPAYKVIQVDATGAGDCFDAAFLCGLLKGKSLGEAARMAAAAGALNAMAFGPMEGDISPETIENMISSQ